MTSTAELRRNPDIIAACMGDETILLNASSWTYMHLNETATRIWERIEAPRRLDELVEELSAEYDVEPSVCRAQVQEFAEEMCGRGFVVIEGA
jgi:hypothetical protein